jgi:hypothetical protein
MERNLFRDEAVKQLTSPEQLDQRMKLAHRREWFALGAAALVVLSVLAWAILGTVETRASGQAMVLRHGGVVKISAEVPGTFSRFHAEVGDVVEPDAVVMTYQKDDGSTVDVVNEYDERVRILEFVVDYDSMLIPGQELMLVEFVEQPLGALVYLPGTTGQLVKPGMPVKVVLMAFPEQQYGYVEGVVESVAPFPASSSRIDLVTADPQMTQSILAQTGTGPIEITIHLTEDPTTPSGYAWSSSNGPDIEITSGMVAQAEIVIEEQAPISLVFP